LPHQYPHHFFPRPAFDQSSAKDTCHQSQAEAKSMGFRAMQFNLVVSTNDRAVRLWRKLGFSVVGTLPRSFRHLQLGYVDALVMLKVAA